MREKTCKHCNNIVQLEDENCPSCGMPLSLKPQVSRQRKFVFWFIFLVLFSAVMVLVLPWFGSSPIVGSN